MPSRKEFPTVLDIANSFAKLGGISERIRQTSISWKFTCLVQHPRSRPKSSCRFSESCGNCHRRRPVKFMIAYRRIEIRTTLRPSRCYPSCSIKASFVATNRCGHSYFAPFLHRRRLNGRCCVT
jgi:hypothetical protein